jgi:SAM-dependent methyltransferase
LAYLLGLEGIALLRAFAGEYDREFTLARIEEIRALLDAADELGDGVEETPMSMQEGYAQWAPWYDEPGNEPLELEEPAVREILDSLPVGVALDAACGTGRHAAYLASLGHRVIGEQISTLGSWRTRSSSWNPIRGGPTSSSGFEPVWLVPSVT